MGADPQIGRDARRRALQRMAMALGTRAAGADDDGAASDAVRSYADSVGDTAFGGRSRQVADDASYGKRRKAKK